MCGPTHSAVLCPSGAFLCPRRETLSSFFSALIIFPSLQFFFLRTRESNVKNAVAKRTRTCRPSRTDWAQIFLESISSNHRSFFRSALACNHLIFEKITSEKMTFGARVIQPCYADVFALSCGAERELSLPRPSVGVLGGMGG